MEKIAKNSNDAIIIRLSKLTGFLILIIFFIMMACVRTKMSNEISSGIVYNASFDNLVYGDTYFSVRASADMAVTEKTSDVYCLPAGSEYIKIIEEAAADKNVKIKVTVKKALALEAPLKCIDNVEVEKI